MSPYDTQKIKVLKRMLRAHAAVAIQLILWLIGGIAVINGFMIGTTFSQVHTRMDSLSDDYPVAIVFGTARYLKAGGYNPQYMSRIMAVVKLYRSRHIRHILISGDNAHRNYNEPIRMFNDLRNYGIPTEHMTLDYAGFSTFDTLVRARRVFGLKQAILVTQRWHLPRALFIARHEGLIAEGYASKQLPFWQIISLRFREWLARAATLGDLYLWKRQPRFLGPKEPIIL